MRSEPSSIRKECHAHRRAELWGVWMLHGVSRTFSGTPAQPCGRTDREGRRTGQDGGRARRRPRPSWRPRPAARSWLSPRPAPPSLRPARVRCRAGAQSSARPVSRHGCALAPPLPAPPFRATPAALRPVSAGPAWGAGSPGRGVQWWGVASHGRTRNVAAGAGRGGPDRLSGTWGCPPRRGDLAVSTTRSPTPAAGPQKTRLGRMLARGPGPAPRPTRCHGNLLSKLLPRSGGGHPLGALPPSSCSLWPSWNQSWGLSNLTVNLGLRVRRRGPEDGVATILISTPASRRGPHLIN